MSNPYNSATERASVLGPTLYFKGDLLAEKSVFVKDTAKICGKPEAAAGRMLKASTGAV
jgi:hypothetical protein